MKDDQCRFAFRFLWLSAFLFFAAGSASGQRLALSDSADISLVTVLPGDAVYSLFGHSAIRVRDPLSGIDLSYSYGTFHFDDPMFVPKFAMGRLDYFLSVAPWQNALRLYRDIELRPAVEQRLNLSAADRDDLFAFLQNNAREENRYYRYDFLFDNCSTRIRDALHSVLGDRVVFRDDNPSEKTFRQLLRPYLSATPFLRLGIDLLLGARTDRVASTAETTFLPDYLESSFDSADIIDIEGGRRPLVASKDSLITFSNYPRPKETPPWPAIAFGLLAAIVLVWTVFEARRRMDGLSTEMLDVVVFGVVGLVGCFLLFMWLGTAHHVTAANWNLAWAWPTHLVFAAALARGSISRRLAAYAYATAAGTVVLIALWPGVPQDLNETFLAIALILVARSSWISLRWKKARAGEDMALPAR